MRTVIASVLIAGLALSGCASMSGLPTVSTIDVTAVAAVQAEIKRQVGVYAVAVKADRARRAASPPDKTLFWCGADGLDFEISSIKVDLLTSTDDTTKVNAGLKIPVAAFTLGPSASGSYEATNVQELVYNEWLAPSGGAPDQFIYAPPAKPAPIADLLMALRGGLIEASRKAVPPAPPNGPQACFTAYNPIPAEAAKDPGDTIKIGFTAVRDGSGGLTLALGVATLGASQEAKATGSSALTVSFREVGAAAFHACPDDKTKVCEAREKHHADIDYHLAPGASEPETPPPGTPPGRPN